MYLYAHVPALGLHVQMSFHGHESHVQKSYAKLKHQKCDWNKNISELSFICAFKKKNTMANRVTAGVELGSGAVAFSCISVSKPRMLGCKFPFLCCWSTLLHISSLVETKTVILFLLLDMIRTTIESFSTLYCAKTICYTCRCTSMFVLLFMAAGWSFVAVVVVSMLLRLMGNWNTTVMIEMIWPCSVTADSIVALSYHYSYSFSASMYLYARVPPLCLHAQMRFYGHVHVQKAHEELKHHKSDWDKHNILVFFFLLIICLISHV